MNRFAARLLHWSPRILVIAYAVFLSTFALDVFDERLSFWRTILALSIHLIPSGIVVAALVIAWRWEWAGAALFALLAGVYAWLVGPRHFHWGVMALMETPLLVVAGLFLAGWMERAKMRGAL